MTPTGRRTIERPVNLFKLKFAICVLSVTRCAKVQETYAVRLLVSLIVIDAFKHQNVFFWTRLKAQPSLPVHPDMRSVRPRFQKESDSTAVRHGIPAVGSRRAGSIPQWTTAPGQSTLPLANMAVTPDWP